MAELRIERKARDQLSWFGGILDPQGAIGKAQRLMLLDATVIMLAVVLPVIVLTLAFAWWFRAGNAKAERLPDWEYSGRIEMIVWSIPILVVLFLSGIAWIGSHLLDPRAPIASQAKTVEIEVVSLDWKWLFIYPGEGVASVNRLVVPVGAPIRFKLTSNSVMNSFFIPQLGSQIYTMAGMTTELNLIADAPGTYQGMSAQFSGDGFSKMRFKVSAVADADYAQWLATTKGDGPALDATSFETLAKPGTIEKVSTFAQVEPGLFQKLSSGGNMHMGH